MWPFVFSIDKIHTRLVVDVTEQCVWMFGSPFIQRAAVQRQIILTERGYQTYCPRVSPDSSINPDWAS